MIFFPCFLIQWRNGYHIHMISAEGVIYPLLIIIYILDGYIRHGNHARSMYTDNIPVPYLRMLFYNSLYLRRTISLKPFKGSHDRVKTCVDKE